MTVSEVNVFHPQPHAFHQAHTGTVHQACHQRADAIDRIEELDIALIAPDSTWEAPVPGYAEFREVEREVELPLKGAGADDIFLAKFAPDGKVIWARTIGSTLIGEGVEFAVATDHNHNTDYGPTVEQLGAASQLGQMKQLGAVSQQLEAKVQGLGARSLSR